MVESSDFFNSIVVSAREAIIDCLKQELPGFIASFLVKDWERKEAVREERRNIKCRIRSQKEKWESEQRKRQENRKRKMKSEKKARRICKKKMKAANSRNWLKFRELKYNLVACKQVILLSSVCTAPLGTYRVWCLLLSFETFFNARNKKKKYSA
ncbi:hypothetical protein CRE_20915 [Caenorhabditis remanei]|uniref:Uncharacterized protein n=1 Tax=Caenorhabditis remanei TaxID=31234 RepID=E3N3S8_CAERE|nr:hypothetical protein CRE_20915 [Caenorhabditis remanei]